MTDFKSITVVKQFHDLRPYVEAEINFQSVGDNDTLVFKGVVAIANPNPSQTDLQLAVWRTILSAAPAFD